MLLCQIMSNEYFTPEKVRNLRIVTCKKTSNELLSLINELDSPSKIMRRQPSLIKEIDKRSTVLQNIRIESPELNISLTSSSENENSGNNHISALTTGRETNNSDRQFLELLCKTRIVCNEPSKKINIPDEEYKQEYKKLSSVINDAKKIHADAKKWIKNSNNPKRLTKTKSDIFTEQFLNSQRSSSMINLLEPVLTKRTSKRK